nr:Ig-like domain-containing protein [Leucobacter weissii]
MGKAATSTAVTLSPSSPSYGAAPTATVRVSSAADTPTGRVTLRVDGRSYQGNLSGGQARIKLTAAPRAGTRTIAVSYAGTDELAASTASRAVTIKKATPKVSLRLAKSTVKRSQRAKVTVTVPSIGALKVRATGTVRVYDGKKRIATKKLTSSARGKVTLSLPKLKKTGAHKIRVRLVGNANLNAKASATRTLRVTR